MKTQMSTYHIHQRHHVAVRQLHKRFNPSMKYQLALDGIEHKGQIGNLSLGAAYLNVMEPLITEDDLFKEGEILINAALNPIRMRCHITYVGTEQNEFPTGVGVCFIDPDENAIAKIIG